MRKILIVISVLLFLNCVWLVVRAGFSFSNTFLLLFGFFLGTVIYAVFYERLQKMKWIRYTIVIVALVYMGFGVFVMVYGRQDTATFEEDVAIVLGSGLRGEEVSATLRNRLDMAVEYHRQNPEALIVVSGGQGPGDVITEAFAMARYLEAAGVPAGLIIQEGGSHSTYQNMRLSMAILDDLLQEGYQVVVITNDFHIFRSVRFAGMVGMGAATSFHGDTPLVALPGALVREVAAIVKMWVIGT